MPLKIATQPSALQNISDGPAGDEAPDEQEAVSECSTTGDKRFWLSPSDLMKSAVRYNVKAVCIPTLSPGC